MMKNRYENKEFPKIFEFIGKNVASSKNAKRLFRGRIMNSKLAMEYYDFIIPLLLEKKQEIIDEIGEDFPVKIHLFFHRDSKRHFDYINISQVIFDALQKVEIIEDDDAAHVIPVFNGYDVVKKEDSGFYMWIEKNNN